MSLELRGKESPRLSTSEACGLAQHRMCHHSRAQCLSTCTDLFPTPSVASCISPEAVEVD